MYIELTQYGCRFKSYHLPQILNYYFDIFSVDCLNLFRELKVIKEVLEEKKIQLQRKEEMLNIYFHYMLDNPKN